MLNARFGAHAETETEWRFSSFGAGDPSLPGIPTPISPTVPKEVQRSRSSMMACARRRPRRVGWRFRTRAWHSYSLYRLQQVSWNKGFRHIQVTINNPMGSANRGQVMQAERRYKYIYALARMLPGTDNFYTHIGKIER